MNFLDQYPRAKKFLEETGYTLDQALIFTEQELKKSKGEKINEEERRRNRSS